MKTKAVTLKILKYLVTITVISAMILVSMVFVNRKKISYTENDAEETQTCLNNPYRGWYHIAGLTLKDHPDQSGDAWASGVMKNDNSSMFLLEINLRNYRTSEISEGALQELDEALSAFSEKKKSIILRFLYDWDGKADQSEPDSLSLIQKHIVQTCAVVNKHTDAVWLMQGCYTGNVGEMNGGSYLNESSVIQLVHTLDENLDPSVFLSVRTPVYQRIITDSHLSVTEENSFNESLSSRLGLFNDGMMGSESDLGTYGTIPYDPDGDFKKTGTRKQELLFQNKLCSFVPNGGEAVFVTDYSRYPACMDTLKQMHISYLNSIHEPSLMKYWKETQAENKSVFDTIGDHLGYRYFINHSSVSVSGLLHQKIDFSFSMTNTGFAPAYRKFDTAFILTKEDTKKVLTYPVSFDNRFLNSMSSSDLSVSIPIDQKMIGTWKVSVSMYDPALDVPVYFANKNTDSDGNTEIGTLIID